MSNKGESFSIKNWSQDDHPREKLLNKGKSVLSDAELVAIIIGSGNRDESAVALCKRILASTHNNLSELGKFSIKQLMEFKGIGKAKAISIIAALELGRRRRGEEALEKMKDQISNGSKPYKLQLVGLELGGKPIEEVEREFGISKAIKLCSNENPVGLSPLAKSAIINALDSSNRYPDGNGYYLKKKLAKKLALFQPKNGRKTGKSRFFEEKNSR